MAFEEPTDILVCRERDQCNEFALVLAAQAIPSQVRWNGQDWVLSVTADSVARARLELEAYRFEALARHRQAEPAATADGDPWPGILVFAGVLIVMSLIAPDMRFGVDWLAAGRMDGARLLDGEWWRAVTALTLHADAAHLIGNILFGSFFAFSVSRYLGSGFAWLMILLSAAFGNVANGLLMGADHRSIGASTAVFAALGLLSAYLWRRGFPGKASRRERMAPVVAGLGLLAFTGTGGVNTDLGAHLLGFVAGFGCGLIVAKFPVPRSSRAQQGLAVAAAGVVVLAWLLAL
jgi:rhomboid protease GluP